MARSRRGRRGGGVFQQRSSNWVVSTSITGNTGTPASGVNWGGPVQTLAPGVSQTFQPVVLTPAATAAAAVPATGECDIDGLDATLQVVSMTVGGLMTIGICVYVSEYNSLNTTWAVRSPLVPADGAREDMIHVACYSANAPLATADTVPVSICMRALLPYAIRIGGGQALHVTLANDANSAGTISFVPFVRARIRNVN